MQIKANLIKETIRLKGAYTLKERRQYLMKIGEGGEEEERERKRRSFWMGREVRG